MKFRLFLLLGVALMIGAGCVGIPWPSPATSTTSVPVTGMPSPEGFIAFRGGFGLLPGANPGADRTPIRNASVRWTVNTPLIPTEVTVIRKRRTMPDSWFAENIASAVGIPSGVLKKNPTMQQFAMSWKDTDGYVWKYDAAAGTVSFKRADEWSVKTVATLPTDADVERVASEFLKNRGVGLNTWGNPVPVFSWNEWWLNEQKAGRCMTSETIQEMRVLSKADGSTIPRTTEASGTTCIQNEYPSEEIIRFPFSQDAQAVYSRDGSSAIGAEVTIRTDSMQVDEGFIQLTKDADRSNYPAIDGVTLVEEIRKGGLRGSAGIEKATEVIIESFTQGLYRHDVIADGESRTFFIPAIRVQGTATLSDGSHIPYASIIPLVRSDQYNGK